MKSLHSKLSGIAPFIFFPLLIIYSKRKKTAYIGIFMLLVLLSSCYRNFYRTNTRPAIDQTSAAKLTNENKYFIIHFTNSTKGLEGAALHGDTLSGLLVTLPPEHSKYLYPQVSNPKNRVKSSDKTSALIEVHLYTNTENKRDDSVFSSLTTSFNRADVYELNKSATTSNHILSTVGILTSVAAIVGIIAASSTPTPTNTPPPGDPCNCPQVYMENNGDYSFASGLYSGAVYSTLERTDYLPLLYVDNNAKTVSFKIANLSNEEQFINQVRLLQVNHSNGANVLPDRYGNILSYETLQSPVTAQTGSNNNVKELLDKTDNQYYSFDGSANTEGFSDVILNFNKPAANSKAKLIIHARNTMWGGLLHKEFINLFGDGFEKWRLKQEKADPKELQKWQTDQALPLMVYVKTVDGWKFVDYFPTIGNTASRDMIMELNTQNIPGDKIEIKLETAYRFWDLDFAAIDYSKEQNITTKLLMPQQAIKSDSTDQTAILVNNDKAYTHLTGNESISFKYQVSTASKNLLSSYILVSGGYYHTLDQITGKTNFNELNKFRQPGAFDKFSREKFKEAQDIAAIIKGIK